MASTSPLETQQGVSVTRQDVGGVPCLVCEPDSPETTCVWFHGGGFRVGSATSSAGFGQTLAVAGSVRVVLVDYRLAPEHPFPAALYDATAVYEDARVRWGSLFACGDSAGANLALGLTIAATRRGDPPEAMVLLSPWCDLTVTAISYETNSTTDQLFSASSARDAASLYLQGWDPTDPLASPLYGQLSGLPPTLIFASTDEVLVDDSRRLAQRLAESGSEVHLHLVPGVPHVWPVLDPNAESSRSALEVIVGFIAGVGG